MSGIGLSSLTDVKIDVMTPFFLTRASDHPARCDRELAVDIRRHDPLEGLFNSAKPIRKSTTVKGSGGPQQNLFKATPRG